MHCILSKQLLDELLEYMMQEQYSYQNIKVHRIIGNRILKTQNQEKWNNLSDALSWFQKRNYSKGYWTDIQSVIRNIELYQSLGHLPTGIGPMQRLLLIRKPSAGRMNLLDVQDHLDDILGDMRKHGFSSFYIEKVSYTVTRIIILARTIPWDSYQAIWNWFQSQGYRKGYLHDVRSILGMMEQFHIHGFLPSGRTAQNSLCLRENRYSKLCPEFKAMIDFSCETETARGLKASSVRATKVKASSFLLSLQSLGQDSMEKVTGDAAGAFFFKDGVRLHGQSTATRISIFFRNCIPLNPEECRRIMLLIPKFHSTRKNIQYLTAEECSAFRSAITDMGNGLSYKFRAIGTVAYYTGIRSTDIANLQLDSISLSESTIMFTQEKTGHPTTLPLSPVVGNAVYNYCVYERPSTDCPYLFVGDFAPHGSVTNRAIAWAVGRIMEIAGIRQGDGDRKGTHIFRHHVAATLAQNSIPAPVISATMGHTSPKALDSYLHADMVHLKECALDISIYPISGEVFSHV